MLNERPVEQPVRPAAEATPLARMHEDGRVVSEATYAHAAESGGASWTAVKDYTLCLYSQAAIAAAVSAERELCASICDALARVGNSRDAAACAAAIRGHAGPLVRPNV